VATPQRRAGHLPIESSTIESESTCILTRGRIEMGTNVSARSWSARARTPLPRRDPLPGHDRRRTRGVPRDLREQRLAPVPWLDGAERRMLPGRAPAHGAGIGSDANDGAVAAGQAAKLEAHTRESPSSEGYRRKHCGDPRLEPEEKLCLHYARSSRRGGSLTSGSAREAMRETTARTRCGLARSGRHLPALS